MKITYYVEDGYIGSQTRPHNIKIDDDELNECESRQDKIDLISDAVQSDFENKISFYWDDKQLK